MTAQINAHWLGNPEPGTQAWHENRKGITGTKISAIIGSNPYKSAYTLWAEETGQIVDTFTGNDRTEFGAKSEPIIRDMFTNRHLLLCLNEPGQYQHATKPEFRASPDALLLDDVLGYGVLEIKFTSQYWASIPQHYIDQVQWYMYVLDVQFAWLAAFTAAGYKDWFIERDNPRIAQLVHAAEAFTGCVDLLLHPQWDGSNSTYETVRELSPGLKDETIELGDLYVELYASKVIAEKAAEAYKARQSQVLAYLDGAKYGTHNGETKVVLQSRTGKPFITYK